MKKIMMILVFMLVVVIGFSQEKKVYYIPKYETGNFIISLAIISGNTVVVGKDVWINKTMFENFLKELTAYTKDAEEMYKLLKKIEAENSNIELRWQ